MDFEFRNEFEYDWCFSALGSVRTELQKMQNSRWLILGQKVDTFLEACIRFLRFADLQLQLNLKLDVLVGADGLDTAVQAFPFATVRSIDLQQERIPAEYCVHFRYMQASSSALTEAE